MKGNENRAFEKTEPIVSVVSNDQNEKFYVNPQINAPNSNSPQMKEQFHEFYTGNYVSNPYKKPKSSSCTYVLVFLFFILMICAVLTGIYLTNRIDDGGSKTSNEFGKLPNKLLNLGKNLFDDFSAKLDKSNSSLKINSSRIIQDNKINLNEISNFATNLFKKINDTINERL